MRKEVMTKMNPAIVPPMDLAFGVGKKRWWSREWKLEQWLVALDHQVILVDIGASSRAHSGPLSHSNLLHSLFARKKHTGDQSEAF